MIIDIIIYFIIFLLGGILGASFITYLYLKIGALNWAIVKERQWHAVQSKKDDEAEKEKGHARTRRY